MKRLSFLICMLMLSSRLLAQHSDAKSRLQQLDMYHDSLTRLGKKIINSNVDLERKNANDAFIRTLVSALKVNNSFLYKFDSVKTVNILNAPDNRFRIFSWYVMNEDGSYRFYGAIQMNTGGQLQLYPLVDYSPLLTSPEDSVVNNKQWYGAEYYKIVPVYGQKPYYVLLGWKGNTVESTKKVIDVLSFQNGKPVFGMDVFQGNGKSRKRVVFEYARQASMMLKYLPDQHLIVFDHLAPPDKRLKDQPKTFGPDLSYDGYRLTNGKWQYVPTLDMRNLPDPRDNDLQDPREQAKKDKAAIPVRSRP